MIIAKALEPIVINSLDDMVRIYSRDMVDIAKDMVKLSRRNKKSLIFSLLALGGTIYLSTKEKKSSEKIDRLEEKYKNLYEDYHNYVISHAEYDPDKDPFDLD